mmetsp:Transcript_31535/g.100570  ORF Transcript_31535/g.100570 Transcript_31535/m.100570 type:complete len:220 (+) Transcript_31535:40-699(+)|eukprot:CAMPEP_0182874074 /NCGR_PEP_ID=MMETSP0034_2-20130328/12716_1 /TAXON_ID=156128 /ORGANISM="Nephroselmis pyriformis, Strain CCMP717" /LENGTH=219 /DNA_ID=CAMNT_0025006769 /DNA_START=17 /DNA_END=676 /DNA_ORIENTATION=+
MENPPMVNTPGGAVPAPFVGEQWVLRREGVEVQVDCVGPSGSGTWSARGALFLSHVRMVFVAGSRDPSTGLFAFDIPLSYLRGEKFNQPIFSCNNLTGVVFPAREGGGPYGTFPPHNVKLLFKEGGVGTFLPLFFHFVGEARAAHQPPPPAAEPAPTMAAMPPPAPRPQAPSAPPAGGVDQVVRTAYVDPSDPTTLYITSPVSQSQCTQRKPHYPGKED